MMPGYCSPQYANSLSEFGVPWEFRCCEGWALKRPIPCTSEQDAMGCYPLFACRDWSQLPMDLKALSEEVIAFSLVTDPFGNYQEAFLKQCFVDIVTPFKQHFVTDLKCAPEDYMSRHHVRNARRALRDIQVEHCGEPIRFLDDWVALYSTLIERHKIQGMTAFSRDSFARQFQVPGMVAFRAAHEKKTVGMLLWYAHENIAYYHLGAHSPLGYELLGSFALFHFAIQYFTAMGLRWLNLGAGAGLGGDGMGGLTRFKRGWSTGTRTAYFCGRIFDRSKYQDIVKMKSIAPTNYFPAYRHGEF